MNHRSTMITVAAVAAVLIAAYLIGLAVRHARLQRAADERQAAAEKMVAQQLPGGRRPVNDQKQQAELRNEAIETVNQMPEQERAKMVENQVRSRMGANVRPAVPSRANRVRVPTPPGPAPAATEPNKTTDGKR